MRVCLCIELYSITDSSSSSRERGIPYISLCIFYSVFFLPFPILCSPLKWKVFQSAMTTSTDDVSLPLFTAENLPHHTVYNSVFCNPQIEISFECQKKTKNKRETNATQQRLQEYINNHIFKSNMEISQPEIEYFII